MQNKEIENVVAEDVITEDTINLNSEIDNYKQKIPVEIMSNKKLRKIFGIKLTPIKVEKKPGRNEKCLCGSGKKYKHCCINY